MIQNAQCLAPSSPAPALPSKREVWSLCKEEHTARAFVRVTPHGQELCLYVDGWLVGSQLFGNGDGAALDDVAIEHCHAFEARGWTAKPLTERAHRTVTPPQAKARAL